VHPICFHIGSRPIYWYGIMAATAFVAAGLHWSLLAPRRGWPRSLGSDLAVWLVAGGILGARLNYVVANLDFYLSNPGEILRVDHGGLIFYGGVCGGAVALLLFARRRGIDALDLSDFTLTGIPLAHALGRVGCLLNGCCYGKPTSVPWAVWLHDAYRHPTQAYESLLNIVLYGVLLAAYRRQAPRGTVTALYLIVYPAGRFLIEFLRGDERLRWGPLDVAQWISLILTAAGVALLLRVRRGGLRPRHPPASPAAAEK